MRWADDKIDGTVVSVAPASGSVFSLLPPDNATGNFTKIVQRVPVRIQVPLELADKGAAAPRHLGRGRRRHQARRGRERAGPRSRREPYPLTAKVPADGRRHAHHSRRRPASRLRPTRIASIRAG